MHDNDAWAGVYDRPGMTIDDRRRSAADWLEPQVEQQGLTRYLETVRERWKLILSIALITTLAAAAYVATAQRIYASEADVIVQPFDQDDAIYTSLGLIGQASDPTRDVETVSRLIMTNEVRRLTNRRVGPSVRAAVKGVRAEPVAVSNIVAITVEATDPRAAATYANALGQAFSDLRDQQLNRRAGAVIQRLRARLERTPATNEDAQAGLVYNIDQLEQFRQNGDPTVDLQTQAEPPRAPIWPRPLLSVLAGLVGGLVLGVGGAFGLQALDPRLRREEQLRGISRLPVLARVPREALAERGRARSALGRIPLLGRPFRAKEGAGPLRPEQLSPPTVEAHRTLRATLAASRRRGGGPRAILVAGASAGEGKTTTAINLAASLALAGNNVILIEADLRRPTIGKAVGATALDGTVSVLLESASLEDALVTTTAYGPNLRFLLARYAGQAGGLLADWLFLPAAQRLLADAKELADFVIIDSPPITEVIDALPLAQSADDVLLVSRLGHSRLTKLRQMVELLARHEVHPAGFAVIGVPAAETTSSYYIGELADLPSMNGERSPRPGRRTGSTGR
jgi:Mrp family chromosome partitioning ATPase/capsular polysaccharide biosynthesis protein